MTIEPNNEPYKADPTCLNYILGPNGVMINAFPYESAAFTDESDRQHEINRLKKAYDAGRASRDDEVAKLSRMLRYLTNRMHSEESPSAIRYEVIEYMRTNK